MGHYLRSLASALLLVHMSTINAWAQDHLISVDFQKITKDAVFNAAIVESKTTIAISFKSKQELKDHPVQLTTDPKEATAREKLLTGAPKGNLLVFDLKDHLLPPRDIDLGIIVGNSVKATIKLTKSSEGQPGKDKEADKQTTKDPKIIANLEFEKIDKDKEFNYSESKGSIRIAFSSPEEANKKIETLLITSDPTHPDDKTKHIKGTIENSVLLYQMDALLADKKDKTVALLDGGKKRIEIKLVYKKDLQVAGQAPIAPVGVNVLEGITLPRAADARFLAAPNNFKPWGNHNDYELIYSFCNKTFYYTEHTKKFLWMSYKSRFRPRVGSHFTLVLDKVPNPMLYEVTIGSEYQNFNIEVDDRLQLLNGTSSITKLNSSANSALTDRKRIILGYLYTINAQIKKFMSSYADLQCIDQSDFKADKKRLEKNIDKVLKQVPNTSYMGDLQDYLLFEFNQSDTAFTNPIQRTYTAFKNFNVSRYQYYVPKLGNYDELTLMLSIHPKSKSNATHKVDSMQIPVNIYGGLKVDVSPGFFYSFFSNDLYSLRTDSTGSTKVKKIVKESKQKNDIGFSTLAHIYSRWGKNVNIAASLGAGLTLTEDPEVRYLGGISLLFGRINRFALNAGYSFGRVEVLSDKYFHDNGSYRDVHLSETKLETKKDVKFGWWVGVSYNFPLLKRKEAGKGTAVSETETE